MRARPQTLEIPRVAELRQAAFQRLLRTIGERGKVIDRRDTKLVRVMYDFEVALIKLESGAAHGGVLEAPRNSTILWNV